MHFIGRDIAELRQNIDFQPQKVGGQRIGFAHKDWKVGGQLPAQPNRLRRLCKVSTERMALATTNLQRYGTQEISQMSQNCNIITQDYKRSDLNAHHNNI